VFKNESVYSLISKSANWNFGDPYYIRFFSIEAARGGRELVATAFGKGETGPETVKPWLTYYRRGIVGSFTNGCAFGDRLCELGDAVQRLAVVSSNLEVVGEGLEILPFRKGSW
jgi:hypothetical protein